MPGRGKRLSLSAHLSMWGQQIERGLQELALLDVKGGEITSEVFLGYEGRLSEWEALMKRYDVRVHAVNATGHFYNWPQKRRFLFHHDRLAHLMDLAGIRTVVLTPGLHRKKYDQSNVDFDRMCEFIHSIVDRYRSRGIRVSLHPHRASTFFNRSEIDRLMAAVPSYVEITPDIGHCSEAGVDVIRLMSDYAGRVTGMHLKNYHVHPDTGVYSFSSPISGDYDFGPLLRLLARKHFTGPLTIELENSNRDIGILRKNVAFLRAVAASV